ncbi:MAG: hypothetical protein PHZ03_07525, partial [Syntrophomonas sp.]|nr:hypothetical protein [Syntrophomonas sp.]
SKDGLMSRCHGWQGATIYSGIFRTILRCQNAPIPPVLPRFATLLATASNLIGIRKDASVVPEGWEHQ